mmetsp:Transcript_63528/g.184225  ORF Transcript_63528/g.184225 Transcript_63528/m.184225 type:complete len:295 (-) Transcript_63528:674-1558(-)
MVGNRIQLVRIKPGHRPPRRPRGQRGGAGHRRRLVGVERLLHNAGARVGFHPALLGARDLHGARIPRAEVRLVFPHYVHVADHRLHVVHKDRRDDFRRCGRPPRGTALEQVVRVDFPTRAHWGLHDHWRISRRRVHRGVAEHRPPGGLFGSALVWDGRRGRLERSARALAADALRTAEAVGPPGFPLVRCLVRHAGERVVVLVHRPGHGSACARRQVRQHRPKRVRIRGLAQDLADVHDGIPGPHRCGAVPGRDRAGLEPGIRAPRRALASRWLAGADDRGDALQLHGGVGLLL